MPIHIKVLIARSKSFLDIHEFCCCFHTGESILANLKYLIFIIFWGGGGGGFYKRPMAKIESETPAL